MHQLKGQFEKVEIIHVPRSRNYQADALSKLGASGNLDKEKPVIVMEIPEPSIDMPVIEVLPVGELGDEWYTPMWNFVTTGTLPADKLEARKIKRLAPMYSILNQQLYKRGYSRRSA